MRRALAAIARRPVVVLVLAACNLAVALYGAAPLSGVLAPLVDQRPAASRMVDDPDDYLAAELLEDRPEVVTATLQTALVLLLAWGPFSWIVAGSVLHAYGLGTPGTEMHPLSASARHARRLLAVGALGLPLRLVPLAAPAAAWLVLRPLSHTHGLAALVWGLTAAGAVGAALWSLTTVALDCARGFAVASPTLLPYQAVLRGLWVVRRRPLATLRLAALSAVGLAASLAVEHGVIALVPGSVGVGALATAAGALARTTLTAAVLVAAAQLARAAQVRPAAEAQ
jgi:hypothetical protein